MILGLTGHYTGTEGSPTRRVAATTRTGAAMVIRPASDWVWSRRP